MPAAENFVTAVNNALELICSHPARWLNKYKDYHEISLKKYPFTLIRMDMDKELQLFYLVIITKILKKNIRNKFNHAFFGFRINGNHVIIPVE